MGGGTLGDIPHVGGAPGAQSRAGNGSGDSKRLAQPKVMLQNFLAYSYSLSSSLSITALHADSCLQKGMGSEKSSDVPDVTQ